MLQHPSDVAGMPIDISNSSAGACQRFAAHLQLQLSTITVLIAAAWAVLLHAAQSVLASISSGFSSQTAVAKSHLLLLKSASPSRFYYSRRAKKTAKAAALAASPPAPASGARACSAPPAVLLHDRTSTAKAVLLHRRAAHKQQQQLPDSSTTTISHAVASTAAAQVVRIPMQLQEHRGRLTVALDLDETLLCTYRIESCCAGSAGPDTLQLVPPHHHLHPAAASCSSTNNSTSSTSSSLGTYSISRRGVAGVASDLGAAARASAWMHYTPPAGGASCSSGTHSSSSSKTSSRPQCLQAGGAAGALRTISSSSSQASTRDSHTPGMVQQQQQTQHKVSTQSPPLAPHTLAVFERPGCREFLEQLSTFCEVVLFTAASPEYGAPLADMLDPTGKLFCGRVYGDACVNRAGRRGVKDLQCLGRDVRRVVLVDNCLFSFLAQPRNGLPCMPFRGGIAAAAGEQEEDSQLLEVILPLLRSLAQVPGGSDVRPLLDSMFRVRHWLASKGYHTPDDE